MIKGMMSVLFTFALPAAAWAADQKIFSSQLPAQTRLRDGVNYGLGMRFLSAKSGWPFAPLKAYAAPCAMTLSTS